MSADDILRSHKTSIVKTLGADYTLILNKAYDNKLITALEYSNLKSINNAGELVDKILNKEKENRQLFLKLLQSDEAIQKTFPELKNILKKENRPVQASSVENTDNQPQRGEEGDQYELKSQPTGLCLIINNKTFPADGVRRKDVRRGTDEDAERLGKVFSWLGFRVLMCKDQTKVQMERALKCFASQPGLSQLQEFKVQEWTGSGFTKLLEAPQHGDAFICCVLSHGDKGVVFGTDRKPLRIKEITRTFTATDQSPLTAKPKVFLIQACQGDKVHPKVASDDVQTDGSHSTRQTDGSPSTRQTDGSHSTRQTDGSDSTFIPQEADFLVHTATVEDYYSVRNTGGSWFIQSVCKQLEEGCKRKEEIEVILRRVNKEVAREDTVVKCDPKSAPRCGPTMQMPAIWHTLRKHLVLTPRN